MLAIYFIGLATVCAAVWTIAFALLAGLGGDE